jgi:DNA-binding CsgD family transcriptional regulator
MAKGREADVPFGLTGREPEVLELVARGLTNDVIAQRLFLSSKTIRNYVSAIFTKLDVNSRAEVKTSFSGRIVVTVPVASSCTSHVDSPERTPGTRTAPATTTSGSRTRSSCGAAR